MFAVPIPDQVIDILQVGTEGPYERGRVRGRNFSANVQLRSRGRERADHSSRLWQDREGLREPTLRIPPVG